MIDSIFKVTPKGADNGYKRMHRGGISIGADTHYASDYTPLNDEQLRAAVEAGDLEEQQGEWIFCGCGYNWVPA